MKEQNISKEFSQEPSTLYENFKKLKKSSQQELCSIEEGLVSVLYAQQRQEIAKTKQYDENDLAVLIEQYKKEGKISDTVPPDLAQEVYQCLLVEQRMQEAHSSQFRLPDVLKYVLKQGQAKNVETKLQQSKSSQKHAAPTIVAELVEDGITVLKSTYQGIGQIFQPAVVMRGGQVCHSNDNFPQKIGLQPQRSNRVVLYQKDQESYLQYELLRDLQHSTTLLIRAPKKYRKTRLCLKQNESTIDSCDFDLETGKASFKRIGVGEYDIHFSGAMEHSTRLIIRERPKLV